MGQSPRRATPAIREDDDPLRWETEPSVLLPRKAVDAPAVAGVAVMILVELAFEPVEHVEYALETRALERLARLDRAIAAAADEHHRTLVEVRPGDLLHLPDEMRIQVPVGAVIPRHHHRPVRMADEHVLHLAAAIDEDRIGAFTQEAERVLGFEMSHGGIIRAAGGETLSCKRPHTVTVPESRARSPRRPTRSR